MTRALTLEPGTREFDRRAREGNLVPVSCEVVADLDTPISAYLRLRDLPQPFLLESVEGGEKLARYSFLGAQPRLTLKAFPTHVEVAEGHATRRSALDPLEAARAILQKYRPVVDPSLPRFYGGLVGWFLIKPVNAALAPEVPVGVRPRYNHRNALRPGLFPRREVDDLGPVAVGLRPPQVHPQQHIDPIL